MDSLSDERMIRVFYSNISAGKRCQYDDRYFPVLLVTTIHLGTEPKAIFKTKKFYVYIAKGGQPCSRKCLPASAPSSVFSMIGHQDWL